MENILEIYKCPICLETLTHFCPRYPKAICSKCADSNIKDNDGNLVSFHNIYISGGFISKHTINNNYNNSVIVEKKEHECWVNNGIENIKCYADEARFGGIVIQIMEE